MKVLITGGGTGGHIMPALAIAQKIMRQNKSNHILYVGTKDSLESEIATKEGLEFKSIDAAYIERKKSLKNIKTIYITIKGITQSFRIMDKFKPDIVIGTGGYVCGAVVLTASIKGIPTLIHEQNAYPGITNKILSRFVNKIAISFKESEKRFKYPNKLVLTGNPVRNEIINSDRMKSRKKLGIKENQIFIYSFGGSGGQKSLNKAMIKVIKSNYNNKNVSILHVPGKRLYDSFINDLKQSKIENLPQNIKVIPYMYDAPSALSACDIVIGSSGAITIAEITALGKPSVLIPKAYTAENHQEYNARALEKEGAAEIILEKDISGERLNNILNKYVNNKELLIEMSKKSKRLGNVHAEERIYRIIVDLTSKNSNSNK